MKNLQFSNNTAQGKVYSIFSILSKFKGQGGAIYIDYFSTIREAYNLEFKYNMAKCNKFNIT